MTKEEFIIKARQIHGDTYDYSNVVYKNRRTHVSITCKLHGNFLQTPCTHFRKKGCAKCGQIKANGKPYKVFRATPNGVPNRVVTLEDYIARARAVHGNRYDYSISVYKGGKHKIEIICLRHGSFWKEANNHVNNKQGCPKCRLSKGEVAIAVYLDNSAIEYEMQKTFPNLCGVNGGNLKYDFFIPSRNMLIEYDGEQHFGCKKYKNLILSDERLKILQENDEAKNAYVVKNSIGLLRIPFTEKDNLTDILREKVVEAPIVKDSGNTLMGFIGIQDGEVF